MTHAIDPVELAARLIACPSVTPHSAGAFEMLEEAREAAARRLHVDRRRDRVAVVLDEVEHRQLAHAGGVERLPEFAFARRAFADRDERHFVALELRESIRNRLETLVETSRFGDADAVQALRGNRAARRRDVQPRIRPVRRHLATA